MELTHKGESLMQIEKFDRPQDSDEDDEDETGDLKGMRTSFFIAVIFFVKFYWQWIIEITALSLVIRKT